MSNNYDNEYELSPRQKQLRDAPPVPVSDKVKEIRQQNLANMQHRLTQIQAFKEDWQRMSDFLVGAPNPCNTNEVPEALRREMNNMLARLIRNESQLRRDIAMLQRRVDSCGT